MQRDSSTSRSLSPPASANLGSSHRRRVVTTPAWARNLPPEFPDDDGDPDTSSTPLRRRSVSGALSRFSAPTAPSSRAAATDGNSDASTSSSPLPPPPPPPPADADANANANVDVQSPPSVFQRDQVRRSQDAAAAADRWWTFTLPSKYLVKVQDYVNHAGVSDPKDPRDEEEAVGRRPDRPPSVTGSASLGEREKEARGGDDLGHMKARLQPPNVFSTNQSMTPSWSSPWTPFRRETSRNPFGFPSEDLPAPEPHKPGRFQLFILHNPFAPLVFRFFNLSFSTCTLAVASHIRIQEVQHNVIGVIGSSTFMALVVCPFAMIHIFLNLYLEYFGQPIGLWAVRTKMAHTLTELIFICLFSSLLSLAFDDLVTSSLECTAWTPYSQFVLPPASLGSSKVEGSLADSICTEQIALVVLVFCSVGLYIAVLVVSLLRIFVKVTTRR